MMHLVKLSWFLAMVFWCGPQFLLADRFQIHDDEAFLNSFIKHYEFSPEGRYVHEYHPFILKKTIASFEKLEHRLKDEKVNLVGRNIIFGYEEQAVPNYYTDFRRSKIQDEASLQNRIGWSLRLHNRFGFMTGFLFKDVDRMHGGCSGLFTHINAHSIPIFEDRAIIFQEHAFGQATDLVFKAKNCIMHSIAKNEPRGVFTWLIKFWQMLYGDALKVSNDQVAGTQDILFSIEYANYLFNSSYPIGNFFIGPDITYPIEVFAKQDRDVTRNAQTFVHRFTQELHPQGNKKTAYMFCSFVDGVGKSTMLGNIKNWMKHRDDIDNFGHVDNSSSQLAELFEYKEDAPLVEIPVKSSFAQIFEFKENTYIIDMPAQISHFTYKPDGFVFVDVLTRHDQKTFDTLRSFAVKNKKKIQDDYAILLKGVQKIIQEKTFFAGELNTVTRADLAFIRNLYLLDKVKDSGWMPFVYENNYYLVNGRTFREIRYLTTLAEVTSEGLKNIESEQMLFFEGVRLPLSYDIFLDDLMKKIQDNGIENIVFVDFASMYPRSCRENIRINYLVQQLALLNDDFKVKNSSYRDFVSGGELLHLLKDQQALPLIYKGFYHEACVRLLFSKMILEKKNLHLSGVSIKELSQVLKQQLDELPGILKDKAKSLTIEKIKIETNNLEKLYGQSKSYVNLQLLSWPQVAKFSDELQQFFNRQCTNRTLMSMWKPEKEFYSPMYEFDALCKNETTVTTVARLVRSSWYAAIANLLFATEEGSEFFGLNAQRYCVPAVLVQKNKEDMMTVSQRVIEQVSGDIPVAVKNREACFNLPLTKRYGIYKDDLYRLDWNSKSTSQGVFAYSAAVVKGKGTQGYAQLITRLVQKFQERHSGSTVMTTTELYERLQESVFWESQAKSTKKQAVKNGYIDLTSEKKVVKKDPKQKNPPARKCMLARPEQYEAIRIALRMLATLEMIFKDPEADVVIRNGNRDDFKAALKLLVEVTLPKYFYLYLDQPLFEDYDLVEPYPSWERYK